MESWGSAGVDGAKQNFKPGSLSSMPRAHTVEGENSHKLSSDGQTGALLRALESTLSQTPINQREEKVKVDAFLP